MIPSRVHLLPLVLPALLVAGSALAAPGDGGLAIVDGSAPLDLSLMPRDLDYPDTECGCAPAPKLLHPDFGLNEASVDLPQDAADVGADLATPDAGVPDAQPRDRGPDLGQPSADLPWGCQLGERRGPASPPFAFAALALVLLVIRTRRRS